jgi:hypothetical protein
LKAIHDEQLIHRFLSFLSFFNDDKATLNQKTSWSIMTIKITISLRLQVGSLFLGRITCLFDNQNTQLFVFVLFLFFFLDFWIVRPQSCGAQMTICGTPFHMVDLY